MKRSKKKYFGKDEMSKKQKTKKKVSSEVFLENELLLDNDLHFVGQEQDGESTSLENEVFSADYIFKIIKNANKPLRLDDILRYSKLTRRSKKEVLTLLKGLISEGKIIRLGGASYVAHQEAKIIIGKLIVQRSGSAFVSPLTEENGKLSDKKSSRDDDIFIPSHGLKDAWNGDIVEISILPKSRNRFQRQGLKPEGIVQRVVERGQEEFMVRLEQKAERQLLKHIKPAKIAFMARPLDNRYNFTILTPDMENFANLESSENYTENDQEKQNNLQAGDLVIVQIVKQLPSDSETPLWLAKPLRKFGDQDRVSVQEEMAKLSNSVPINFPDDVLEEAKQIAVAEGFYYTDLDGEELKNEVKIKHEKHDVDLRHVGFVTIDGADSKDFDDAIFVEKTKDGWQLMVAIADVSAYVLPFSKLDKEARVRGNSYYFPNSVEPMLPEFLSNGLCSLRPNEDHRIMFAKMHFGKNGIIQKTDFGQGIISSKARLTYEAVQEYFDEGKAESAPFAKNLTPEVMAMLSEAKKLAEVLIARRHKDGYLRLEIPEPRAIIENDKVVGLGTRSHFFAHELIEAFMVAANEAVAEFLTSKNAPCLYRAHPAPTKDKLERLKSVLQNTAIAEILPPKSVEKQGPSPWLSQILQSLKEIKNKSKLDKNSSKILPFNPSTNPSPKVDSSYLVHRLVLRSMMQARYTPILEGHFGLASNCYCHFTSPIRRYSDLLVHRSLKAQLGIIPKSKKEFSETALLQVADICNECERKAFNAEREVFKRLSCLFMQDKVGLEFDAIISGVTNFGIFAELSDFGAEGMVRMEYLGDDYFVYDEATQCLYGEKSSAKYRLGDFIRIKVQSVEINNLEINFSLVGVKKRKNKSDKKSFYKEQKFTQKPKKNKENLKHNQRKNKKKK